MPQLENLHATIYKAPVLQLERGLCITRKDTCNIANTKKKESKTVSCRLPGPKRTKINEAFYKTQKLPALGSTLMWWFLFCWRLPRLQEHPFQCPWEPKGDGGVQQRECGLWEGCPTPPVFFFFLLGGAPCRLPVPLHLLTSIYGRLPLWLSW